jgi:Terpene cyclase DEP1
MNDSSPIARLSGTDKVLCGVYALLALAALGFVFGNTVAYLLSEGNGGVIGFFAAGYVNYATSSITNDLLLLGVAAVVLMVVEARRVGVRFVWAYVAAGFLIAISVAFPLFLLARQLRLAATKS